MSELGNRLLYCVSANKETSYFRFSQMFDSLYSQLRGRRDESVPLTVIRRRTLAVLDQLGHVEVRIEGGRVDSVYAAEAVLNRLPVTGTLRFVLGGRRSPDTLDKLRDAVRSYRNSTYLVVKPADLPIAYSPDVIELDCESIDIARAISDRTALQLVVRPAAWDVLDLAPSLKEYCENLSWAVEDELAWERWDFSRMTFRYGPPMETDELRLIRYSDGSGYRFRHYLRSGPRRTEVAAEWGKYILLQHYDVCPIKYNPESGALAVRTNVGLPRYLARAVCLCRGMPAGPGAWHSEQLSEYSMFENVPDDIFKEVKRKLGYKD